MSQRNGDKARFGRERQRKILRRQRLRELQKELEDKTRKPKTTDSPASS